jgi:hypothetical protein
LAECVIAVVLGINVWAIAVFITLTNRNTRMFALLGQTVADIDGAYIAIVALVV